MHVYSACWIEETPVLQIDKHVVQSVHARVAVLVAQHTHGRFMHMPYGAR